MDNTQFGFDKQWYTLWMQQSQQFFTTATSHLQDVFNQPNVDPEIYLTQIQTWMEELKQQLLSSVENNKNGEYYALMTAMSTETVDLMLAEWINRSRKGKPVSSVRELYEIWLTACQKVYKKSLQSEVFQHAYSECLNTALKGWMPRDK